MKKLLNESERGGCEAEPPQGFFCVKEFHHNGPCVHHRERWSDNESDATPQATAPALRGELQAILHMHEAGADWNAGLGLFRVFDLMGHYLFSISPSIDPFDLATLFTVYKSRYTTGVQDGRAAAFASLRALIGIDAAIATAIEARRP